jgi:GAF domain-containing protein
MVMKFLSLPKVGGKRESSTSTMDSVSSQDHTGVMSLIALEEQCTRLSMENRRLRQITARIADKIGVHYERPKQTLRQSSVGGSVDGCGSTLSSLYSFDSGDDIDCPPPHTILAQAHRLQKLNEMVVALSLAPRVMDAYKIVARYTREIVGAARVSISILGSFDDESIPGPIEREDGNLIFSDRDYLEVFGLDGDEGLLPIGLKLPIERSQIGSVVTRRIPVRVLDCGNCVFDWVDIANLHQMGIAACVDVPLISSGKVLGTLNTGVTDAAVYYPEVEQMLLQISAVLANAMEKERLLLKAQNVHCIRSFPNQDTQADLESN